MATESPYDWKCEICGDWYTSQEAVDACKHTNKQFQLGIAEALRQIKANPWLGFSKEDLADLKRNVWYRLDLEKSCNLEWERKKNLS